MAVVAAGVLTSSVAPLALPSASRRVQPSSTNTLQRRHGGGNANMVRACDGGGELASSSGLNPLGIEAAQYNLRSLVILEHFM